VHHDYLLQKADSWQGKYKQFWKQESSASKGIASQRRIMDRQASLRYIYTPALCLCFGLADIQATLKNIGVTATPDRFRPNSMPLSSSM
jgi:hypothetical protein